MTVMQQPLLCQSLDTGIEQPVIFHRQLMPGHVMGLRSVSLHNHEDLQTIHRWMAGGYMAHMPPDQLHILYRMMAECTYAQAFMVLHNDKPAGLLEISHVLQDELKDAYEAGEGDYRLYVPVLPGHTARSETTTSTIQYCLHFMLSCTEVDRIIWAVPVPDKERNKIAVRAGMHLLTTIRDVFIEEAHPVNLFCTYI